MGVYFIGFGEFQHFLTVFATSVAIAVEKLPHSAGGNEVKVSLGRKSQVDAFFKTVGENSNLLRLTVAINIFKYLNLIALRPVVVGRPKVRVRFQHKDAVEAIHGNADRRDDGGVFGEERKFETVVQHTRRIGKCCFVLFFVLKRKKQSRNQNQKFSPIHQRSYL